MITYTTRNLFDIKADAYVNPVNLQGVMGAGLAKEFKKRYPEMEAPYKEFCKVAQPGDLHVWYTLESDYLPFIIVNFPTKIHWKDKSTYELIDVGLDGLCGVLAVHNIKSVVLPALGCGLGGLDYKIVSKKIEDAMQLFPEVDTTLVRPR